MITVTRNFGPLTEQPLLVLADWARIGRLARERIVRRTVAGLDETGASFAPYSAGYAKQKAKIGASARVNLTLSGDMLNNITVEPDANGVTLSFAR